MISVIIPLFNSENTIVSCVESVLGQTRADFIRQIIIVDDGSTDQSAALVKERFHNNPKVTLIQKENGGVSTARNTGIKRAKSEWIALLDADDVWHPKKIEKQWRQIKRHPQIAFIGTNRNKENLRWGKRVSNGLYALDLKHILLKNWPHTSTVLIRRSLFQEVGLFNEKMRYAEDGDMWNRIACKYWLYYITESLETAGGNKMQFGESGLSSNLKGMYDGNLRNLKVLRKKGKISSAFYIFLKIYNDMKYVRRKVLTGLRRRGAIY